MKTAFMFNASAGAGKEGWQPRVSGELHLDFSVVIDWLMGSKDSKDSRGSKGAREGGEV